MAKKCMKIINMEPSGKGKLKAWLNATAGHNDSQKNTILNVGENVVQLELWHVAGGNAKRYSPSAETVGQFSYCQTYNYPMTQES